MTCLRVDRYATHAVLIMHAYFTFLSSICGGLLRWALSPIRVPLSLPDKGKTSPVGSSRARLSINDLSAWSTRLEFYKIRNKVCIRSSLCGLNMYVYKYTQECIQVQQLPVTRYEIKKASWQTYTTHWSFHHTSVRTPQVQGDNIHTATSTFNVTLTPTCPVSSPKPSQSGMDYQRRSSSSRLWRLSIPHSVVILRSKHGSCFFVLKIITSF